MVVPDNDEWSACANFKLHTNLDSTGLFVQYWGNSSDCNSRGCRRDFLANISRWNWSVNDADFCDEGGSGPTRFIYCLGQQTAPANFTRGHSGGGYHVGEFPGNESQWLSSFFVAPAK